jgi:hypothetical protein
MWLGRFAILSIFLLVVVGFIATALNEREVDELGPEDTNWHRVFSPFIWLYYPVSYAFVISTFVQATILWNTPGYGEEGSGAAIEEALVSPHTRTEYLRNRRILARIHLFDGSIYLALLVTSMTFLILLIAKLYDIDAAAANQNSWSIVFVPLYIFFIVLVAVLLAAAFRVCGEERTQSPIEDGKYAATVCGGLLVCCPEDQVVLERASTRRQDKQVAYVADGGYHDLPCVFMCTPTMTFGVPDYIFSLAQVLLVIIIPITLAIIALAKLDRASSTSLHLIFSGLYAVESVMLLLAPAALWCVIRAKPDYATRTGRLSVRGKYAEIFLVAALAVTLIAQQALLVKRIESTEPLEQRDDWFLIFMPSLIFLLILSFVGCGAILCDQKPAKLPAKSLAHHSAFGIVQ